MQIDELSSSNDPLLQPFKLKHLTLKNRIMSTSHACGLDENGLTGNKYQAYHEEKARGGLALTMFGGSASVAPDSLWPSGQVDVSTDAIIPLFEQFTAKIHHHGCALMCQISHRVDERNAMPVIGCRRLAHRRSVRRYIAVFPRRWTGMTLTG